MGSSCCSDKKCGVTEDECSPEKASGRYSSLNPSRRCSFMLETPRASTADNNLFAKSVPGSPWANHKTSLSIQANMIADPNSEPSELDCTNPLFTPLLIKLLMPGGKQDPVQPAAAGDFESEVASSQGSSTASPLRCSLDVEVMSSGRPSWYEPRSFDHLTYPDLLEMNDARS